MEDGSAVTRGILYIVWGDTWSGSLMRSMKSVKYWHPELETHVAQMPPGSNVLCKSQMYDLSPFDETLFLDADTTVLGKLDYGFLKAQQHGIALCINLNPWQRRYQKLPVTHPDEVEYSSGVVFFDKGYYRHEGDDDVVYPARDVFKAWSASSADSRTFYQADDGIREQLYNDQALLTAAIHATGFNPFVLPLNWNLYTKWQKAFWGEVKIHHGYDDIPPALLAWNAEQSKTDAIIKPAAVP
jgi:hypothetical protein